MCSDKSFAINTAIFHKNIRIVDFRYQNDGEFWHRPLNIRIVCCSLKEVVP